MYQNSPPLAQVDRGAVGGGAGEGDGQRVGGWGEVDRGRGGRGDGHTSAVNSVAWSPDGATLASASYKEVRLWRVSDGQPLRTGRAPRVMATLRSGFIDLWRHRGWKSIAEAIRSTGASVHRALSLIGAIPPTLT
jgi:WD40 repeat protein